MPSSATLEEQAETSRRAGAALRSELLILASPTILLLWTAGEVVYCLSHSAKFRLLVALFLLLVAPIALRASIALLLRSRLHRSGAGNERGRGIWGVSVVSVLSPVAAVLTARAINPDYSFPTPLLRFTAALMHHL